MAIQEEAGEALTCIQRLDRLQRPYSAGRDSMHTWRTAVHYRLGGFQGSLGSLLSRTDSVSITERTVELRVTINIFLPSWKVEADVQGSFQNQELGYCSFIVDCLPSMLRLWDLISINRKKRERMYIVHIRHPMNFLFSGAKRNS